MKVYGGTEVQLHKFFIIALDGVVSFLLQPLYLCRKDPHYSWNMRLGGPQIGSQHFGEERNLLLPVLSCQFCSLATILTELSWWPFGQNASSCILNPHSPIHTHKLRHCQEKSNYFLSHSEGKLYNSLLPPRCLFTCLYAMMWWLLNRFSWYSVLRASVKMFRFH